MLWRGNFKFDLSIENSIAHPFDDIVVKYSKQRYIFTRLIQCKNKESGEFSDFDLKDSKRGYSLLKYLRGFHTNIRNNFSDDYELILCTNARCTSAGVLNLDALNDQDLIADNDFSIPVYNFTQNFKDIYRNECPYELTSSCEEFFGKLRFWVTPNTKEMKTVVLNELKKMYDREVAEISYFFLLEAYRNVLEDVKVSTSPKNVNRKTKGITHEYLTELHKKVMKICNSRIWYEMCDPKADFHGMDDYLKLLKSYGGSAAIVGPEGAGKTELAIKFASDEKPDNCIFIDSKDEDTFRKSVHTLAFYVLRIKPEDFEDDAKELQAVLEEVNDFFLGSKTIFIFDDVKDDFKYATIFSSHQVIITSGEENLNFDPKIVLNGFKATEAEDFVLNHLPEEERQTVSKLTKFCDYNPQRIRQAVDIIKGTIKLRELYGGTFGVEEFLEMNEPQQS
ncbi:hypothetical protein J437_LFUL010754 [Ladona fulva]|uniref:Uncharacterized protein n=1 Tax=Ladona fulva TaxID=123851 RepID=A0A8K0P2J2_LADFU|nr:hypothetical protein J437_LFUL010754 [Ladona fulva]